mgnify:FL=1|jgi:hypothetical protein
MFFPSWTPGQCNITKISFEGIHPEQEILALQKMEAKCTNVQWDYVLKYITNLFVDFEGIFRNVTFAVFFFCTRDCGKEEWAFRIRKYGLAQ